MPLGHPQQIRATTNLERANMAKLSLILSADRMSIAHNRVDILKSHTFRNLSYKDIHIQRHKYTKWVGGSKTREDLKLTSSTCSDVARRTHQEVCSRHWLMLEDWMPRAEDTTIVNL